ncbi:energy transducer TonB [Cyclobacteriaceae bacterium]|nr:energy transducer TonB [Cyclobacteriaceae bacterium]
MKKQITRSFAIVAIAIALFSFTKVITIAQHYTGGEEKLLADIQKAIVYPAKAKRMRMQGTVYIHCKLLANGTIAYTKITKKIGGGCDDEAVRVVKSLKFNAPGYDGEYNIPVKFTLKKN